MADFLLYALLAGIALALVAGPLGSFVVWRRMAYFGDTLSHAALLGVALGFLLDISPTVAVTVGCLLLAILLVTLQQRQPLASDTLLGILAPSTLSLGLVVLSFMHEVRIDLMAYLFGDLLAISPTDLAWILGGSALVMVLILALWRPLLAVTVHEELARVEGLPVTALRMTMMLLIAVVIAVAMKIVGVLLITSLLIIPAAAAQSRWPWAPACWAWWRCVAGCRCRGSRIPLPAPRSWSVPVRYFCSALFSPSGRCRLARFLRK